MLTRNAVASCSSSTLQSSGSRASSVVHLSAIHHLRNLSSSTSTSAPSAESKHFSRESPLVQQFLNAAKWGNAPSRTSEDGDYLQSYRDQGWTSLKRRRDGISGRGSRKSQEDVSKAGTRSMGGRRAFSSSAKVREQEMRHAKEEVEVEPEAGLDEAADELVKGNAKAKAFVVDSSRPFPIGSIIESRNADGPPLVGIVIEHTATGLPRIISRAAITAAAPSSITYVFPALVLTPDQGQAIVEGSFASETAHGEVQRLRRLTADVEKETSFLVQKGALDLHSALVATSPELETVTVDEALQRLGVKSSPSRHYAMHCLLMADSTHFIADQISHYTSNTFTLRSSDEITLLSTVQRWYRTKSPELEGFVSRAAAAREWSRNHPPVFRPERVKEKLLLRTWSGPNWTTWTENDAVMMKFLRRSLDNNREYQPQPYLAVASSITKLVGDKLATLSSTTIPSTSTLTPARDKFEFGVDGEVMFDRKRIAAFMSEIGAASPWENWSAHDGNFLLSQWDAANPIHPPPSLTTSAVESVTDPIDSVRRDFGSLPVYVVDDAGAQELDDGLSVEPGPATSEGNKTWWIHAHVADPTSVLKPSDEIALLAAQRVQTVYLPEGTWTMLPHSFTSQGGLSLGSSTTGEQKTLTLSTRVDEDGEVYETKVNAGVVRQVLRFTYDAVDKVLGHVGSARRVLFSENMDGLESVRGKRGGRALENDVLESSEAVQEDMKLLHQLALGVQRRRAKESFFWTTSRASPSVTPSVTHHYTLPPSPVFFADAPLVSVSLPDPVNQSSLTPASVVVSEFMVLANRTAARFCVERGIPVPFRTQSKAGMDEKTLADAWALRDPATGEISQLEILKLGLEAPRASIGVDAAPHWMMGINDEYGYTKVTSPLRRYGDMLCHWQIKAGLLSPSASSASPFSRSAVLDAIAQEQNALRRRGRIESASNDFWSWYVMSKHLTNPALDQTSSAIRNNLTAVGMRAASFFGAEALWSQKVFIPELGLQARLQVTSEEKGLPLGGSANVRLREVELSARSTGVVELKV